MRNVTISDIRRWPYRLPMRSGFTTAHGTMATREGAIIEIVTREGAIGIGEIAPLPAFGGGTLEEALASLSLLTSRVRGRTPDQALALLDMLQALSNTQRRAIPASTLAGLECALLDLIGQARNKSVSEVLAAMESGTPQGGREQPSPIPVNVVAGSSSIQEAIQGAREAIDSGFHCLKLKMGAGSQTSIEEQVERVAAVREALGQDFHLRLDANAAWSFEEARLILRRCEPFALQYVEQPLPAGDLAGMRRLRQETTIPLAADEAVESVDSAQRVLAAQAADLLIIKPQLTGGLRASRQIIRAATARGIRCVITSALESGVDVAADLHLTAASPEVTLECGLATLPLLADDLLLDDLPIQNGWMPVPDGPGLGVHLDRAALEKYRP